MNKQLTRTSFATSGKIAQASLLPQLCSSTPEEALALISASKDGLMEEQVEARFEQYGPSGMIPLPSTCFAWLVAILLSYCLPTQFVKVAYIRRFGQWL